MHPCFPLRRPPSTSGFVLFLVLTVGMAGCGSSENESGGTHEHEGVSTGATCPTDSTLTYANFGQGFMSTYCLRCHTHAKSGAARNGAPSDHNFDTQSEIQAHAHHIDTRSGAGPQGTNTQMPTGSPTPTEEERRQLSEWLACGAP